MTQIALLGGDFEILFEDETVGSLAAVGLKLVRRTQTASDTVYTTNALYSAIADASDEFQAMDFENPMLPVTPNAYTMENDYFIPRSSTEFLKEGAVSMDWDLAIRSIEYTETAAFVFDDIGRRVIGGTTADTGTLLDFEVLPNGNLLLWIRPDTPADTFQDAAETLSVVADGGVGNGTSTTLSTTGTQLYSSVQVIGSVPTATEVYLIQDRQKMTNDTGAFQWWATDTNVSLGIIDILIRVRKDGTLVADGDVEVFGRRYTSLYDNFRLNVAAGGRSALPLASAPDINNVTGYRTFTAAGTGTGTFNVGNGIYVGTDWATATAKAVITAVGGDSANPIIEYYMVGDLTDLANGNAAKEYIFSTGIDGDATATVVTPTANPGGPTDGGVGEGGTVVISLGTRTFDHDGDAIAEAYSAEVNAQGLVTAAKVYERIKYVTRRGGGTTDLFGAGVNVPGETYRGLEVQAQYDTPVGTFGEGEDVDVLLSGFTGRSASVNTTDTYVMLMAQETSVRPLANGDVLRDEALDTVTINAAPDQFTSPKASPFGVFTGSQIFGARGILFSNPHTDDTQSYILTDDGGTLRNPPNTVSFVVNNTLTGDRVLVARDTGTNGIIDKDQFGGIGSPIAGTTNGLGDQVLLVTGTIDSEVPQVGYVRVVETTLQQEHHYVYASRVSGAGGTFTLKPITTTAITTASGATGSPLDILDPLDEVDLVASGSNWVTEEVEVGMLVRNTTALKTTQVWEVVAVAPGSPAATDTLTVRPLYGLVLGMDFDVGNTFEINRLIGDHTVPTDYARTDDLFDLILDLEASSTTTSNTFVKTLASNFATVVNVRQGKVILPFTQNASVGDGGASVTVVRAADTIAT